MNAMTLVFIGGAATGVTIVYILSTIHDSVCKWKQNKVGQEPKYEVVKLDDGGSAIPKTSSGNNYNQYLDNYDRHLRENFDHYIKNNVYLWWREYENRCIADLVPIERTTCKYVKCIPLRLSCAISSNCYTYIEFGSFKIKARPVTYFDAYNMEIKITNTVIKESEYEK